jgi:hypothetical protein
MRIIKNRLKRLKAQDDDFPTKGLLEIDRSCCGCLSMSCWNCLLLKKAEKGEKPLISEQWSQAFDEQQNHGGCEEKDSRIVHPFLGETRKTKCRCYERQDEEQMCNDSQIVPSITCHRVVPVAENRPYVPKKHRDKEHDERNHQNPRNTSFRCFQKLPPTVDFLYLHKKLSPSSNKF